MAEPRTPTRLFRRGSWAEDSRIAELLRQETVGGALLLVGTVVALVWANSPIADSYADLLEVEVGPASLHLHLTLETWAADGLLAVFFFVVGLELKREFVAGDLRDPRRAALPILAAVGGMIAPALIYVAINLRAGAEALGGWAIPTATDIAFALAVLAVISTHLPTGLRTFLLTLAVVDDLLAVAIIAVFYTSDLHLLALAGAMVPLGLFALAVQRRVRVWWVLLPLAVATWVLMHESGVHATVAGVLLGFTVPVLSRRRADGREQEGMAQDLEHRITPFSTGFAVPVFAFFAAGVTIGGLSGLTDSLRDTVALGITLGLVVGKFVGVLGTTYLVSRFTRADLDEDLSWIDVAGLAVLAGIGFTVSLLIGDLSFEEGSAREDHVKVGVLTGSLVSALLATAVLRSRNKVYRRIEQQESADSDADGIPDVYQRDA
ncbi:MAG TPA: Na+/H+ antiporter NhaA [Nocardioides sp.]|uniref:Na+/H+ antiporter NhaA n=1 Tax=Nocardioides sp. TaxID=35761 RepID=UPI002D7EF274|nr:Na+/H+ antiporter NhaA [Nocardioides sp.]HET6651747.1 Na+/H+ antiporter NhaA [Nocardioides sp.]